MLQIVVLEGGSVVEQGSHEALLSFGGRYTQLWNQQTVSDSNVNVLETIEATNESART
jgi:ABC-type transport system involved in cytochrome bd biosynthesis fused ATPase/permease subunit